MTNQRGIEVMSGNAYHPQIRTPPIVGGATPSDREIKGVRALYMATEKKTLNEWRKMRGLEAKELGEVSGVGTTIGNFLYKGHTPRVDVAVRLAEAVGVELGQIQWGKTEQVDMADLPPMPKSPPFDPREGTPVVSDEQMRIALIWAEAGRSKKDVYEAMGVSHQTFYKVMQRYEELHGPVMFRQTRVKKPRAHLQKQATEKPVKGSAKEGPEGEPASQARKGKKDVL